MSDTVRRRHKIDPKTGVATQFTKDRQPSPERKSNGKLAKKAGGELMREILAMGFVGMKDSELRKRASEYFGITEDEITVETMMAFRQIEKSIQKADTQAFRAVEERAFGLPKGESGVSPVTINQMIVITRDEQTKEELKNLR